MIPYREFCEMEREIAHLIAGDRLVHGLAVAHGAGIALGGDSPGVQSETRELLRLADPALPLKRKR